MNMLLVVLILVSLIQTGTITLYHIQNQKIEKQRIDSLHSLAFAVERSRIDQAELDSLKHYMRVLLQGLGEHELVLGDVLAANEAQKEKTSIDFKKLVDEATLGFVKYSD